MSILTELDKLDANMELLGERLLAASAADEVVGLLDFALGEGKSLSQDGLGDDGLLRIEGRAATYDLDRQNEAFMPGAFEAGVRKWIERGGILLWHHKYDQPLGVIEDARIDSKGLWIRGRLDNPEPGTEHASIWRRVKSGTVRGLSIGGIFKRKQTPQGPRIYEADIVECSLTPAPVQPDSLFTLTGKAVSTESVSSQLQQLSELVDLTEATVTKL